MNDPRLEIAVERALRAEAEYRRLDSENRAHNRRMVWIVIGVALWIAAIVFTLVALWPTL